MTIDRMINSALLGTFCGVVVAFANAAYSVNPAAAVWIVSLSLSASFSAFLLKL